MLKTTGVPTKKKVLVDTKGPPVEVSVVTAVTVPVPDVVAVAGLSLWEAEPVEEPGEEAPLLAEPVPDARDEEVSDGVAELLVLPLVEGGGRRVSGKTGKVDVLEVVPPPGTEPVDDVPPMDVPVEEDPGSGVGEAVPEVDVPAAGPVDVEEPDNVPDAEEVEATNVEEDDVSFRSPYSVKKYCCTAVSPSPMNPMPPQGAVTFPLQGISQEPSGPGLPTGLFASGASGWQ